MHWSESNTFRTSYEGAHSKKSFRPQMRLYRAAQQASSTVRAPPATLRLSQRVTAHSPGLDPLAYISIYDSSYQYKEMPVDSGPRKMSGFSRNSKSQIGQFLRPATAPAEVAALASEYRQSFVAKNKFKI